MRVKFKNGGIYEYHEITELLWKQFMLSESKGKFFANNIKKSDKIKATKVEIPKVQESFNNETI